MAAKSTTKRVYLDHASAMPWHRAALEAHQQTASKFPGDPTRRHREGRYAHDLLEGSRAVVASTFGGAPERVAFTSGGTEAIHLAVLGAAAANRSRPARIISSAIEHSAVLAAADHAAAQIGGEHVLVGVDGNGVINLEELAQALTGGALLVNVLHASHEVGTLQPLHEVAALCREHDALLHVDACQSAGRLPISLEAWDADFMSLSASKFGGGRGTGALLWSPRARLLPLQHGDEREHRMRAGLQHLPGIAALGEALLQLEPNDPNGLAARESSRCDALRWVLRNKISTRIDDVAVHGPEEGSAPHIVALSAMYCDGETMVTELDRAGFSVHSGSSCATTSGEPSHVLVAMQALTHGHVRVSLGPGIKSQEVDAFVDALVEVVKRLRA